MTKMTLYVYWQVFKKIKGAGSVGQPCRKKILDPYLTSYTEISFRWITDTNVKCKTMEFQRNIGEQLCNLGGDKNFLNKMKKCYR